VSLQRREKILAGAAGAAALLAVLAVLLGGGGSSRSTLRTQRDQLLRSLEAKKHLLAVTTADAKKLAEWQNRSLPSDSSHARSLYQDWIRALADRAKFHQLNVAPGDGPTKKNIYTISTFTVSGRADLAKLTSFLYEFYSAGHLHRITRIDIKPQEKSGELDINITAEAMSLASTDRKDQLSKEQVAPSSKLADYSSAIVKRNLFGSYAAPLGRPDFDVARYTDVTAVTEVDGRGQVWIHERTTDKVWKLSSGQSFRVGPVQGSVKAFVWPQVVINVDGQSRLFRQGDNLRGGAEVPQEQQGQPAP
jgi:hypothetical protein